MKAKSVRVIVKTTNEDGSVWMCAFDLVPERTNIAWWNDSIVYRPSGEADWQSTQPGRLQIDGQLIGKPSEGTE